MPEVGNLPVNRRWRALVSAGDRRRGKANVSILAVGQSILLIH